MEGFNPKEKIKAFKIEYKEEEYLKFPSPHYLNRYAQLVLDLMDKMQSFEVTMINSIYFIKHDLKNLIADIDGNLNHDYQKRNLRYLSKWRTEKSRLDSISSKFLEAVENYKNK